MLRNALLIVSVLFCAATASAGEFDLSLNDYSVQAEVRQAVSEDEYGSSEVSGRVLYNSRDDTRLASVGLDVFGKIGEIEGFVIGVGGKVYGANANDSDVLSFALGTLLRFAPRAFQGFGVRAGIYYSPNVLSGLDAERLVETWVAVDYEIIPRAKVFLSYNKIRVNIENKGNWNADESIRGGVALGF
ncbi:MAG: YfaZ family protein [Proteobacteria bacterium]|nr:YfaZ family protein [Pseudomonadota bacterium]MBU1711199.1 YfaZ family protein [Pseudomonadota bacterium]